eukprot:jgi/Chlat1/1893/Chrsp145S00771
MAAVPGRVVAVVSALRPAVLLPARAPASGPAVRARAAARRAVRVRVRTMGAATSAAGAAGTSSSSSSSAAVLPIRAENYFATDTRPIVLFDGVCNLCNGGVNFVLDNDPEGKLRFAALQSDVGRALLQRCGRHPEDISSIVLVEDNRCHIKSEAILRIAYLLRLPFPQLAAAAFLTPGFVRDTVYDTVATNRYNLFGKSNSCRFSDARFEERFVG